MSSYTHWIPFQMACRLRCLQQGALNVGNTRQQTANLITLALAQIASPSNPPWAKYSQAANQPKKILLWPARVPGFVNPIGLQGSVGPPVGNLLSDAGISLTTDAGVQLQGD